MDQLSLLEGEKETISHFVEQLILIRNTVAIEWQGCMVMLHLHMLFY